jgi:hypothetical protein
MRRALLAATMLTAASCGGSPVAPSPPAPVPTPEVALASGPYTLAITFSGSGMPTCQDGFCTSISFCIGSPSATTASFGVAVDRSGNTATVRVPGDASSLALNLDVAPGQVTGTISGAARDAQGVAVAASGTVSGASPANGQVVSGRIDGQVSMAGGSCSNNGHMWSLTPR